MYLAQVIMHHALHVTWKFLITILLIDSVNKI
jgi:hypothetical protein